VRARFRVVAVSSSADEFLTSEQSREVVVTEKGGRMLTETSPLGGRACADGLDGRRSRVRPGRRLPRARSTLPPHLRAGDRRRVRPVGRDLATRGGQRVRLASRSASGGPNAARPRVAARRRRAGHSRRRDGSRARAPAAERRFLLPARRSRAGASPPAAGSAGAALDAPRVARRAPRRRRDPRNLATGAAHRANRRLDSALAWAARWDRGRG
jgi:hypothetical protein